MKNNGPFALILAGGASSRLFPFNKILSDLTGSGKTLIQQAFTRAASFTSKKHIHILAVEGMQRAIRTQLQLPKSRIYVDPARRGTWPALLWAMAHLRLENPEAVLAVLTGDHVIPRLPAFKRAAVRACRLAAQKPSIVMLGVNPSNQASGWTGFGAFRVKGETVTAFAEKPSLLEAQRMIRQGGWQWNSGMFFFRISTAERALARYQSAMETQYKELCVAIARRQIPKARTLYGAFPSTIPHPVESSRIVDNTIDFAIMTPIVQRSCQDIQALAICEGLPFWTDLGQWESLNGVMKIKERQMIQIGRVYPDRLTQRCILAADRGFTLEVRGLSDAVVAVAPKGLLILRRRDLPAIKEHVAKSKPGKFQVVNGIPGTQFRRRGRRVVVSGTAFIR